jgi:hypothetical protein
MHYTACSKAEPVYLDVEYLSMQPACNFAFEHQLEAMPVSNRSSCAIIVFLLHSSPRRVIKVRSSFLPRGLTRVGDKKVRIVSEAVVCWSRFMLPPATELLLTAKEELPVLRPHRFVPHSLPHPSFVSRLSHV